MKITIAYRPTSGGKARAIREDPTGHFVGEIVYMPNMSRTHPYQLYHTGRGFVSNHISLAEARIAAVAYFETR